MPVYAREDRIENTLLLDYLFGTDIKIAPPDERLVDFGRRVPKLNSAIAQYICEIWGFISELEPTWELASPSTAKEKWLPRLMENCHIKESLSYLWERLAITGEVLLVWFPDDGLTYKLRQFEYCEFKPIQNELEKTVGYHIESVSGDLKYRLDIDAEKYRVYQKVPAYFWGEIPYTDYPHPFGEIPAIRISNNESFSGEGYPDFDQTAIDIAIELVKQMAIPATNYSYFGRPFFVSPNPDDTRKAIARKDVVLQAEAAEDGGNPTVLSFPAMPTDHSQYLSHLKREFAEQMGISFVEDLSGISNNSSLALKILFSSTIRQAKAKAKTLGRGITRLFELALRMAAKDGILLDVIVNQPDSWAITFDLTGEPFPLSPQEKLLNAQIVRSLKDLGINPAIALQEYYPYTTEEIAKLIDPTADV